MSFLSPSRTILLISDDALLIYSVGAKGSKLVEAVPWSAENFEQNVAVIISKECGGKPVLILNDMVEQHYRKEKVPKVSPLDKQNVVKRKLQVAFPNYPVRAALPLKEKIAKTDKALAGSVYIFAAVPTSEAFAKTMAAARLSLAPIAGFCLLPIESSDMIKKLSERVKSKSDKKAQWTVFMGQHQSGGLRQVVIRNGELALTRMTPITDKTEDHDTWAKDVHQEFQATMSYLTRFGFSAADGLNVILISEPTAGDMVGELIETPCNFYSLTTKEASKLLKFSIGVQEDDYHADPLHVAWIGRKSRFILPMKARQIEHLSRPRQVAALASVLLVLAGGYLVYQMLSTLQDVSETMSDVNDLEHRKEQLDLQFSKEVKRKEDLGYNIQLIQSALAVYNNLQDNQVDIFQLFYNLGLALGRDMRIDSLQLKRGIKPPGKYIGDVTTAPLFLVSMQMTFPSTTDAEKGNQEVRQLQSRLQRMLPDHVVEITKLLEDYEYSEEIVVETGDAQKNAVSQDYVAEIRIEGPEK